MPGGLPWRRCQKDLPCLPVSLYLEQVSPPSNARSSMAWACLDVGSGVVECLCKPGYEGSTCERCAPGYYGNPLARGGSCKPCECDLNSKLDLCHALTGECISSGDSSSEEHCQGELLHVTINTNHHQSKDVEGSNCLECCSDTLLLSVRGEGGLRGLMLQLQTTSDVSGSVSKLSSLQGNVSVTESLVRRLVTDKRLLKTGQQEEDVKTVREDLDQIVDMTLQVSSQKEEVLKGGNEAKNEADNLISDAEALLALIDDLIKWPSRAADVIAPYRNDSEKKRIIKMTEEEEARRLVAEEMNEAGCAAWRGRVRHERKKAQKLMEQINEMAATGTGRLPLTTTHTLITSEALLQELTYLLSGAQDAVPLNTPVARNTAPCTYTVVVTCNDDSTAIIKPLWRDARSFLSRRGQHFISDELTVIALQALEEDSARLDGAKRRLLTRIANIFHVVAKVEMISEAEEHAEELSRLDAVMQQVLREVNTSKPLSEANTFDNISTNVEDAAMAADEALKGAMWGGLLVTTEFSDKAALLQEGAQNTRNDLRMLEQSVNSHKEGVQRQKEKAQSLRFDLSRTRRELQRLQRDDTDALLESAKRAAWTTNNTVGHVTHRLRNINNFTVVLNDNFNDVHQAVRSLDTALPLVGAKLAQVEALRDKWPPGGNMTENINRIKELVQETRSYLNRISLATPFSGRGHIELRQPRNAEDMKALTAIDLLLSVEERPPKVDQGGGDDMFVLYLGSKDSSGDYVGMAIRRNVLLCIYKLGGVVHQVETSQIKTSIFHHVVFQRVYQDAEVNITANFLSPWPLRYAPERYHSTTMSGILHLDPQHTVFYVGGYPDDFNPPLEVRHPKYRGYMKLSYINDQPLSLYNYKLAVNMEADLHALTLPRSEVSDYYQGSGYRMALVKEPHKRRRRLFKFRTNSRETDALLFYVGGDESFWCLIVERGYLVLQGRRAGRLRRVQSDRRVSLFGKDFAISAEDKLTVRYEDKHISIDHVHAPYGSFYIGGVPEHIRKRHDITAPPLRGCVDHVTADGQTVEYATTMGVSDGCPFTLLGVRTATLHSSLSADWLFVRDHQRVSLGFRSKHKHGVILRSPSQSPASGHLSLSDGYLVFKSANYSLVSSERYNDGRWHYLTAARSPTRLELSVDNIMQGQAAYGRPEGDMASEREDFKGCIANIYFRWAHSVTPVDLSFLSPEGGVALGQCSLSSPPHVGRLHPVVDTRLQSLNNVLTSRDPTDGQCGRQQPLHHRGYELSQGDSWLGYRLPERDLNYRPHFSLDVRTRSPGGLLLFVQGTGSVPLLALYMEKGQIRMTLGQSRVIGHRKATNDGHWHRVECSVERSTFHLLVDGFRVTDGLLPKDEGSSLDFQGLVYLGGHPGNTDTVKASNIPTTSIMGCIRNLQMNAQPVGEPAAGNIVSHCLEGLTEKGAYFGGGHLVLDDYFTVGSHFVLTFELRPQRPRGLVFYFEGYGSSFRVFFIKNTVSVTVNDGSGDVSVSVTPPNLCDGEFHSIKGLQV
ncbi:laminin subunit alpha-3-like [Nerophis lumbriciformis]|uniref:laminin subunit alpha-3-like n=1 Tax=Nerophis lumbriciformis TaxID=546530 RepID=UPI003BA84E68